MKNKIITYLMIIISCLLWAVNVQSQESDVQIVGKVLDQSGEPLMGVTILAKNQPGFGTTSDMDGNFKIKVGSYDVLVFKYIGFKDQEVPVLKVENPKKLVVTMADSAEELGELVVTAAGLQRKETLTGAYTTVDVAQLKSPGVNLSNSLAGVVPGVIAQQISGEPGEDASEFWIRGISTFGASQSALVLVDGIERSFNEIPVEDIESFSVLKDASATAIYGQRGANGVVLITTKQGDRGQVKINGKLGYSYDKRGKTPEYANVDDYSLLANEAKIARYQTPRYTDQEMDIIKYGLDPDLFPNIDWMDLMLKDGASQYNANVNFSGGGNQVTYFVSGGYTNQDGIYKTNDKANKYNTNATYERFNYRANINMDLTKTTVLKVGIGGFLINRTSPGSSSGDIWGSLVDMTPLTMPRKYSNGLTPVHAGGGMSPETLMTQTGYRKIWRNKMETNIGFDQNLDFITKGLNLSAVIAFDTENENTIIRSKHPELWRAETRRDSNGDLVMRRHSNAKLMTQESTTWGNKRYEGHIKIDYNTILAENHRLGALAMAWMQDLSDTNLGSDIIASIPKRNLNYSGRFTYSYSDRYMAEFNWGYTGSENFEKGDRFGFFPAFSAAWAISQEPFIKKYTEHWLDLFKIRASYGEVGNDMIGGDRFPYITLVSEFTGDSGTYNFGEFGSNRILGYRITKIGTPNLTWEVAKKYNLGFDLSLFNGKFTGTLDLFKDKRDDIFMKRNHMPLTTGLADQVPMANVGKMESKGFDGNIAYSDKIGQVRFTLRGNMTYQNTEIIDQDEAANELWYKMSKGFRHDQTRGLIALGLFKDQEDIDRSPTQTFGGYPVLPGDIKYKDVNGDGIIDGDDEVPLGYRRVPGLQYGMGLSLNWRDFDFSFLLQGSGKRDFFVGGSGPHAFRNGDWGNVLQKMVDGNRWIPREVSGDESTENPNADWPRLTHGNNDNNNRNSTFWLRNGRFLRLKNVEISYTVPQKIVRKYNLSNFRIGFIGENLMTWSPFKWWDPERGSGDGSFYPISKKFNVYLQFSF